MTASAQIPAMIHLKDVAERLGVKLTTLYGDWEARVVARQIPPSDPRYKRPTWHRDQVEAWLAAPPAPTVEAEKTKRQKPDPEGDALRARMNRNRAA